MTAGQLIFLASLAAPAIVGFLVGRWRVLIVVAAVWLGIAIFLRANNGWHGAGWGEFGIELNVLWAVVTLVSAATGVAARRGARLRPGLRSAARQ